MIFQYEKEKKNQISQQNKRAQINKWRKFGKRR
jgi:hypothetical protein